MTSSEPHHRILRQLVGIRRRDFITVCAIQGWAFVRLTRRLPERQSPLSFVFSVAKVDAELRWLHDHALGMTYLTFAGPEQDRLAEIVRPHVQPVDAGTVFQEWDQAYRTKGRIRSMFRLGIAAPVEPEIGFVDRFEQGAASSEVQVRLATAMVLAYRGWPEVQTLAARLAADSDAEVAKTAQEHLRP